MAASGPRFCEVALPVPLDQTFTYSLPETLRHRVAAGCRVVAPFGARKLTGVALEVHGRAPEHECRDVVRLLDETPALTAELISLGRWIAEYYCTPIGDYTYHWRDYQLTKRDGTRVELSEAERKLLEDVLRSRPVGATEREVRPDLVASPEFKALDERLGLGF